MIIGDYLMEILTILAILSGPTIAVRIAQRMEDRKQKRQQKIAVLASLLGTSQGSARMSPEHVNALNLIRLVFYGDKAVIDAHKRYMEYLNPGRELAPHEMAGALQKGQERFLDLLNALTTTLAYHQLDKTDLENSLYAPKAWLDDEIARRENMSLLTKLLKGEGYLWVAIIPPPHQSEDSSAKSPMNP